MHIVAWWPSITRALPCVQNQTKKDTAQKTLSHTHRIRQNRSHMIKLHRRKIIFGLFLFWLCRLVAPNTFGSPIWSWNSLLQFYRVEHFSPSHAFNVKMGKRKFSLFYFIWFDSVISLMSVKCVCMRVNSLLWLLFLCLFLTHTHTQCECVFWQT